MLYHAYELTHAAMGPVRTAARVSSHALRNPFNPFAASLTARATAAAFEMFANATQRYGKPEFGLKETTTDGETVPIVEEVVLDKPFGTLLRFRRDSAKVEARNDPKVLLAAPMSGHYATLLRGTVEAMIAEHDVYITDWRDAREVPLSEGEFDLSDYIDYLRDFLRFLAADGERAGLMAVCQPGVPCLCAASVMAEEKDPARPSAFVFMGSPIDTRVSETEPNRLAQSKPIEWFEQNVIVTVPWPNPGFMRRVYPGFLQLSGFMAMNVDRHVDAHVKHFEHLVQGDGDSAAAHRKFYEEYLAVMDLTAEFYLQTVEKVFQKYQLAKGEFMHRDRLVKPSEIRDIAMFAVEGEADDITGIGQSKAGLDLWTNLPDEKKKYYLQPKVGHYGIFNGSRWRQHIQPQVKDFFHTHRTSVAD